jgi:hypothetical protein
VRRAQRLQVIGKRPQDLNETGESDPSSEFAARRAQDLQARGGRGLRRGVQERRLAHAWLAGEQEDPAVGRDLPEERGDERQFLIASDKVRHGSTFPRS